MDAHIFSLIMDVFFAFALHILCAGILKKRFNNNWIIVGGWICCLILWNICSYLFIEYPIINGLCSLLINFGVIYLLYEGRIGGKLILAFVVLFLGFVSEVISVFLLSLFDFELESMNSEQRDDLVCFGNAISKIICFVFIKIITLFAQKEKEVKINFMEWINVLLVPIGSLVMIYTVERNDHFTIDAGKIVFFSIIWIINIATYCLYQKTQENAYELMKQKLLHQQTAYYIARYDEMEKQWQSLRRTRHNMRNMYILELKYLEDKEYDKLRENYIKTLGELKQSDCVVNTGNISIDSIINYKTMQAKEAGIRLVSYVNLIGDVKITNGDLNVLLGNLFDNAIEAALKLDEKERKIEYKLKGDKTALLFEIYNGYDGILDRDDEGEIITLKANKEYHGIGLKEVRDIVKKYCGTMTVDTINDVFGVKTFLYYS